MTIVFTPWGSLGDLHPYLAVAIEVKRRGHDVLIATSEVYRSKIEGEGLRFHPVRPDMTRFLERPELMSKIMDADRGPEYIVKHIMMPALRDCFDDIYSIAHQADLLISHAAMYATPLVAEALQKPWLSVALQPAVFFSALDAPYFPQIGWLTNRSPFRARLVFGLIRKITKRWTRPAARLRSELRLPPSSLNPIMEGQFSPRGTIALFSPNFAAAQEDWPPHVSVTGFAFYDKLDSASNGLPPELTLFLDAGPPPLVFTLGSSAVFDPGNFYEVSAEAATRLGRRAILLAGPDFRKRVNLRSSANVIAVEYAAYSELFPRAAAIIHSGGIGTTAQALRAGRRMLVMPYSHDQPDNAARIKRLGVGASIKRKQYNVRRVAQSLDALLNDASMEVRAAAKGVQIQSEQGISNAADAIERHLSALNRAVNS